MPFLAVAQINESLSVSAIVSGSGGGTSGGGGGGGGGSGGYGTPTAVTFSGRAYPLSHVTVLKDGQIAISTVAGPDSLFSVTLSNLSTGTFLFSVYGEDSEGRKSTLFTVSLFLTAGATTTVSGIFITPTIAVDKAVVKKGDNVAIFGQSSPSSDIVISVHSNPEYFNTTHSDTAGAYLFNFDTSLLDFGQHETKSKASLLNELSTFSPLVTFNVANQSIEIPTTCSKRGDLNNDCRVNLVDFSIMAYWYKKKNPPIKIDLNSDQKISLADFSILAYNWTG